MFKVIVAGGRDFNNYEVLKARLDTIKYGAEIGH